jgi:hypothetical protein
MVKLQKDPASLPHPQVQFVDLKRGTEPAGPLGPQKGPRAWFTVMDARRRLRHPSPAVLHLPCLFQGGSLPASPLTPGMPSRPGRPLSPFSPGKPGLPKEKTKIPKACKLGFSLSSLDHHPVGGPSPPTWIANAPWRPLEARGPRHSRNPCAAFLSLLSRASWETR